MKEEPKSKGYVLRKLFFACLYLSTFTFGGGYVIVTLLKEKFVVNIIGLKKMKCWIWLQLLSLHRSNRSKRSYHCRI